MKPHGLLFKAEMVRAILAGQKTQTRRPMRQQPPTEEVCFYHHPKPGFWLYGFERRSGHGYLTDWCIKAPHEIGQPLWVRETFGRFKSSGRLVYRADDALALGASNRWTPAIHMPMAASRIHMECTRVRCERLQDIDEADAIAEGAPGYEEGIDPPPPDSDPEWCWSYRASYLRLWDRINGAGSADANPFVWAFDFKVLP